MKSRIGFLTGAILAFFSASAVAQQGRPTLRVAGHLSGYVCMMPKLTHDQLMVFDNLPPIYAEPASNTPQIGVASVSIIVSSPMRVQNGFAQVLHMDGRLGWMRADMLKPWTNLNSPNTRCIPAMMSDGRPGFDYTRSAG